MSVDDEHVGDRRVKCRMLKTGSLSVGGDEATWKVAPFDNDILRGPHGEVLGEHGGDSGKGALLLLLLWLWLLLFRVRR